MTTMEIMFNNCSAATGVDLTGWDFSALTGIAAGHGFLNAVPANFLGAGGYDALLPIIAAQTLKPGVTMEFDH